MLFTKNSPPPGYYVYALIDPRKSKPFYIGEGKGKRAWSHQEFKSGCNNPYKDRIIQKIQNIGLEVIVEILQYDLTKVDSELIEDKTIEYIGIDNLTNITPNSHPPVLYGEANGFYSKKHTAEFKEIQRNRKLGIKPYWHGKKKTCHKCNGIFDHGNYAKSHGDKCNVEFRIKPKFERVTNSRKISIDGIKYNSISEASRLLNIKIATIFARIISPNFLNYCYY